jgi:hypothetical protein
LEGDLVANTLIEVEGNTMGLGVGDRVKLRKPLSLSGDFNPFWDDADFDKEYLIKDLTILVKNDETRTVGHDRVKHVGNNETTMVGRNRKEDVGNNEEITIHGNRTETVDKNETIKITGARQVDVTESYTLTIGGGSVQSITGDD